jgi:hypothetical protein
MNIDSLTYGELKQIAAMFAAQVAPVRPAQPPQPEQAERAVLVTTEHRGVFFGYATDVQNETIKLRAARNVVYWSADCKGFLGLAATGPKKDCKVGPAANIELRAITCVAEVTPVAVTAFEAAPWAK